mmetsp:Transcript_8849/g.22283  ORF Transcript_8849/g.22283 Transcript_8849/m.22283 type:complete len:565 (-) Transcript_8849:2453-4147(-)
MFIMILAFEWAGGLNSVALTDAIQGILMIISFVSLASVVKKNYGGWAALDPESYPKPQFYQTPSEYSQWGFWQFSLLNVSFFILPHLMQRLYAARDLKTLRFSWTIMAAGPWATMLVSVFIGTVGVQILGGKEVASPFSAILEEIMGLGGFAQATATIAFTASLAAIMSTADSLIIAISQLITAEIVYPLRPKATPAEITFAARIVSLVTVIFSLIIGLLWKDGITDLARIQFPLALMVVPAFLWGLYAPDHLDAHPHCIAAGAMTSSLYVVFVYFFYISTHSNPKPIEAGITGLCIQLFIIIVSEAIRRQLKARRKKKARNENEQSGKEPVVLQDGIQVLHPNRPEWDLPHLARFGECALTPRLLNKLMIGMKEPIRNIWYVIYLVFAISVVTPLLPENEPPLNDNGDWLYVPAVVNGLPWWAFKIIMLCIVPYLMIFGVIAEIPDDFPHDETDIAKHGVDPNTVDLTPKELGHRVSYDSRNDFVHQRRQTITQTMAELGIEAPDIDETSDPTSDDEPSPVQRRLSSLVVGKPLEGNIDGTNVDETLKVVAAEDSEDNQAPHP